MYQQDELRELFLKPPPLPLPSAGDGDGDGDGNGAGEIDKWDDATILEEDPGVPNVMDTAGIVRFICGHADRGVRVSVVLFLAFGEVALPCNLSCNALVFVQINVRARAYTYRCSIQAD